MQPNAEALYRQMYKSRRFEEAVTALWNDGHISAEMHLNEGEEAIVAGVLDHVTDGDALALEHRGTAPMVMRGVDLAVLIKEFMGLEDGLCRGMGGHMHLFSPDHLAASSGIVGASGPAACGFAFAAQHLRPSKAAVAFFGEGAMNQGMLMESINLAAAWSLPVIFVCKDNGMAITTPSNKVTAGDLLTRAEGLGAHAVSVDGTDVDEVWRAARDAFLRAREGNGPTFLHATCVRPEGHFLGDPLLRIVRRPVRELKSKVAPLMKAATTGGSSLSERAASLGSIMGMLGRAQKTQNQAASDPVERQRQRLSISDADRDELEREVDGEVQAAVSSALRGQEARA
ncbi:MAG: thiamine pyrophosphate-dependent dehydrogenase E1 component subunit alpha [Myxococcales bacterium]|nr:thiamine pyrophosphate-dependent dehydrogenase E1 component subunit alpha [Myxococcales bacterium]